MKTVNKKALILLTACGLLAAVGVGSSVAYLTDGKDKTNEFTVGRIAIDLTEPNYTLPEDHLVLPNEEIAKDPTVTNTGSYNVIVFISFDIPMKKVYIANYDGTLVEGTSDNPEPKVRELFEFRKAVGANGSPGIYNSVNSGWVGLNGYPKNIYENGVSVPAYRTYVFGFNKVVKGAAVASPSDAELATTEKIGTVEGTEVPPIFDYVRMINVVEGQLDENELLKIPVRVYAIQAEWLQDEDNTKANYPLSGIGETISREALTEIFTMFKDQKKIEAANGRLLPYTYDENESEEDAGIATASNAS
jgi:predicted ribosomally synthesized peptide with SipW-like signal peptide